MNILEVNRVAAFTSATTSETTIPLTFFDMIWLRFPPVQGLYFYEFPKPPSSFFNSLLPKLKHSLSLTLHHFLPLAGNIIWPPHSSKPFIRYIPGDDGVSVTLAESSTDFNRLFASNFSEAEESHQFVPYLTVSHEKASLMSLQITLFPNYGFSIGITTHHAALDGKSATLFMKAWAHICSNLGDSLELVASLPENLRPSFDRSVIVDPCGSISETYTNFWLKEDGGPNNRSLKFWDVKKGDEGKLIRGMFELLHSNIQKLKKFAESKLNNKKVHLSTFSVTCAYMISCLVKAEQTKQEKVMILVSVDCRSRLDHSIPSAYFGNCVRAVKVPIETKDLLGDDGFIFALEAISEGLKKMEDEAILSVAKTWISDMEILAFSDVYRLFSIAGSPRFEVYGIDFGCGKPKKMEIVSLDNTGAISLAESRNGNGGIEIGLVLNEPKMEAFSAQFLKGHSSLSSSA